MIDKDILNETDLIVGNNWPPENEDEYKAEADNQRKKEQAAKDALSSLAPSSEYTDDNIQGKFGSAAYEELQERMSDLSRAASSHAHAATTLDRVSDNIARTKTEINNIQHSYHDQFSRMMDTSTGESWDQNKLRSEKQRLVQQAQERVRSENSSLQAFISESVTSISDAFSAAR